MASEDETLFERWIAPELPWLVAYLASLTGSRVEAEELAQETLVKALQAIERPGEDAGRQCRRLAAHHRPQLLAQRRPDAATAAAGGSRS